MLNMNVMIYYYCCCYIMTIIIISDLVVDIASSLLLLLLILVLLALYFPLVLSVYNDWQEEDYVLLHVAFFHFNLTLASSAIMQRNSVALKRKVSFVCSFSHVAYSINVFFMMLCSEILAILLVRCCVILFDCFSCFSCVWHTAETMLSCQDTSLKNFAQGCASKIAIMPNIRFILFNI